MHDRTMNPFVEEREPSFVRSLFFALFCALFGAAIALAGCASTAQLPPGAVAFVTNSIQRAITQIEKTRERDAAAEDPIPDGEVPEDMDDQDPATPMPASDVAGSHLVFRYGGFNGSKATEDPATQIGAFQFSSSGMSYKWTAGDLGNWGLAHTDAGALACAFYWSDKEQAWIGGKFDWISSSRLTRSWENVRERYNGWDPDAFFSAKRHAFCIVSRDGRKRTNLVED